MDSGFPMKGQPVRQIPPAVPADFKTDVRGCARCEGDHDQVDFAAFKRRPAHASHWALCPKTGEPVLLAVLHGRRTS
jgi:hypothetical protein